MRRIYPPILERSRELRHPLTPAERKLWARLRNGQLGYKIRRQHPIDRFITDFYCNAARLVVEIDGDTHSEPEQVEYDRARTEWLEANGQHVIRFSNDDVHHRLEALLETMRDACERFAAAQS